MIARAHLNQYDNGRRQSSAIFEWVLLGTGWMPQSGRGHSRPLTIIICTSARACVWCMGSAATSNFCVYTYNGHRIFFVRSVATKLHACVKSTIPACCSFCRTVAERLRQQWHDLASSPGPWDEARLSLSFNWMQTSLLAPSYDTITNSSVTQTGRIS